MAGLPDGAAKSEEMPKSRSDAIATGATEYFTGKPCKHGHIAKRNTRSRACAECRRIRDRKRYTANPERKEKTKKRLWKAKGYPEPTREMPDQCEMCGGPPTSRSLHLDHDHNTGEFRGWLCHYCNTNLGRFGDDRHGLMRALSYLYRSDRESFPAVAAHRKKIPLATGFLDYFRDAVVAVAECSLIGHEQHNPGKPLHWDRSKSSDEADALMRHLAQRGEMDGDGIRHSAKVAWRAMALLQREIESERIQQPKGDDADASDDSR